jgi:hypothetical protein
LSSPTSKGSIRLLQELGDAYADVLAALQDRSSREQEAGSSCLHGWAALSLDEAVARALETVHA